MLEIIPQHTFTYGDGVPAYKSGEWYGSKPNHFIGSKLILKPIKQPEKEFKIGHSIHFPPKYSEEYKFIPGRRKLYPLVHDDTYKPQKRYIVPKYSELPVYPRNIGIRPSGQINSDFIAPLFQKKIRVSYSRDNSKIEYGVESVMTRKKRILSLYEQRNKMIDTNPGDKNYKCVENSPDFFKDGGLIVGSTNRMNYNKTTRKGDDNFYQTLDLGIKVLNDDKLWKSKITKENMDMDKNYVANLNKWEENTFEENNKENKK
jgi:hypothetical protein